MQCITTISYKIIINGEHTSNFSLNKKVKQRDHLSSYIFILYLNVLLCMLNIAKPLDKKESKQVDMLP